MSRHISPSILAADFGNLEKEIGLINVSAASWLHCDVMDGVFVPNISFGIPVVEMASRVSKKPLDVHLMIVEPEKYIDRFCKLGIDICTLHIEACSNTFNAIQQIKKHGVKAGITLKPHTPVEVLKDIIGEVDIVLVMSVEPGFGGQSFIETTYQKVKDLKELIYNTHSKALIQVDGGVTIKNARQLFGSGVDILITGTTVFKSDDPVLTINKLINI